MANTVRILITAKDEISGKLDQIKDKATVLSKTDIGKGLAMGAGIAAFGLVKNAALGALDAVVSFGAGSVQAAKEEAVGIARLSASLQANVKGWDGHTEAIEKNIAAMVKTTGFSDGEMRDSLAKLVGSTRDVSKAFVLQQTAMDLARFKGIGLVDASTALIKVEGGQYRALKELGIVLKQGATQTEALAEVQRVAGGQMSAYMETLAGKTDVLNNRLGDLQEELGTHLTPAFLTATEAALGFMDALDASSDAKPEDRLGDVVDVLNILNPTMWTTNLLAGDLGKAQKKLADDAAEASSVGADAWATGSESVMSSFAAIAYGASDAGEAVKHASQKMVYWAADTRDKLDKIGTEAADALYDPLIEKAELARLTRERAEQQNIATSKKSTKAQVRDAHDRITELDKSIFESQVKLVGWGKMSAAKQKAFLADLRERWKNSTGDARIYIGRLIAQIENIPSSKTVTITVKSHFVGTGNDSGRAAGGPVAPYSTHTYQENGPELLISGSSGGRVMPSVGSASSGDSGVTLNLNVSSPLFTPGSAEALATAIVPLVTKAMQRQQLIPRR